MSLKIFNFQCANGHVFEAWIRSDRAEDLPEVCPACGDGTLRKLPSAAKIRPVEGTTRSDVEEDLTVRDARKARELGETLRAQALGIMREVARKAEDVGEAFPETVRNMEKGSVPKKLVRGTCTPLEERTCARRESTSLICPKRRSTRSIKIRPTFLPLKSSCPPE